MVEAAERVVVVNGDLCEIVVAVSLEDVIGEGEMAVLSWQKLSLLWWFFLEFGVFLAANMHIAFVCKKMEGISVVLI